MQMNLILVLFYTCFLMINKNTFLFIAFAQILLILHKFLVINQLEW